MMLKTLMMVYKRWRDISFFFGSRDDYPPSGGG